MCKLQRHSGFNLILCYFALGDKDNDDKGLRILAKTCFCITHGQSQILRTASECDVFEQARFFKMQFVQDWSMVGPGRIFLYNPMASDEYLHG